MKAAIYARVSTFDKGQDPENQLVELRRYCTANAWEFVEFIEHASAKSAKRDEFQSMFAAAARREFGVVVVWALDRFTREGVAETFIHIKTLLGYGVQFESFSEAHFRTTGPAGELMIAIAAWIAKQERLRISARTKAGMATAKAKGKQIGAPLKIFARDQVVELRESGLSWRKIGVKLGINEKTARIVFKDTWEARNKGHRNPPRK